MQFSPPLQSASLLKRYKRFLADVHTADGQLLTIHCANTGAMTGCATPGDTVWYSVANSRTRRYPCSWELTETQQGAMICVNTLRANTLTDEALRADRLPELSGYQTIRTEARYQSGSSRCDFLLTASARPDCYLEVKSVTLAQGEQGFFPDAVTERGQKHLRELMQVVRQGQRAVLLFVVMHSQITRLTVARHIDVRYACLLDEARYCGVEVLAYQAEISPQKIVLVSPVTWVT